MPKRSIRRTLAEHPEAAPEAAEALKEHKQRACAPLAPVTRREMAVRKLVDKWGDPLDYLGKRMKEGDKEAARALLPYVYPSLKAIEVSGPGGSELTIEIRKLDSVAGALPASISTDSPDNT